MKNVVIADQFTDAQAVIGKNFCMGFGLYGSMGGHFAPVVEGSFIIEERDRKNLCWVVRY